MYRFIFLAIIFFIPYSVFGISYQEYIYMHNSNQCSNYFEYAEDKHSLPKNLLRSISAVETGRWHSQSQLYFFWPWAVNQGGKAYYYANKEQAIMGVKKMLEKGLTSIDIGCMQINLHHHPDAFFNLDQAFEPKDNIEYAASFLKRNYQLTNDWYKAVASYHSQADIGKDYAEKVLKICSNYNSQTLAYNPCMSNTGEIISCNSDQKISSSLKKEKLPFSLATVNNIIAPKIKPRKDPRRLKSNMIPYSITNETN